MTGEALARRGGQRRLRARGQRSVERGRSDRSPAQSAAVLRSIEGRLAKTDLHARTIAEFARTWPQESPGVERLAEHGAAPHRDAILDCIARQLRDGRAAPPLPWPKSLDGADACQLRPLPGRAHRRARRSGRAQPTPAQQRPRLGPVLAASPCCPEIVLTRRQIRWLVSLPSIAARAARSAPKSRPDTSRTPLHGRAGGLSAQPCHRSLCRAPRRQAGQADRLVACMRKLIVTLNAMVRDGSQWQPRTA